jgi:hypothetical protein
MIYKYNTIIANFKGSLDPKEISELNKNDDAGFKWKNENPKANDQSTWNIKRLQTRQCTTYSTVKYRTGEGDREY